MTISMTIAKGIAKPVGATLIGSGGGGSAPSITAQPAAQSANEYGTATFSLTATGATSYQWQRQANGAGGWSDIGGATSNSYTTGPLTKTGNNSDNYRCNVTNAIGTTISNVVALTVFNPTTISGLQLWLDAAASATVLNSISPDTAATNGQTVRRWSDRSGNGYDANQATGANQALLDTSAQNSRGGISFDGTNDYFTSTITGFQSLANVTMFFVVKPSAAAAADTNTLRLMGYGDLNGGLKGMAWISSSSILTGETILFAYDRTGLDGGRIGASGYSRASNTAQIICCKNTASGTSLSVNGSSVSINLAAVMTTSTASGPSTIGYTTDDDVLFNASRASSVIAGPACKWCECLIYNSSLSAQDAASVTSYLNAKWAIY